MQSLKKDEKILFQAIPSTSLLHVISIIIGIIGIMICFPTSFLIPTYIILYSILILLTLFKCFDKITITNQRISLRILLVNKTIHLAELNQPLCLTIKPYVFKKYEWQRKLLRQDFQKFWQNKASLYFPHDQNLKVASLLHTSLSYLRLDLFSKRQSKQIVEILAKTWQLKQNIHPPTT